ncbi:MAG: 30S ribosomal protein S8 [Thermodesulfobacteria bacterium]|nr:30S ribosomal protein S8 [Thermodesulfobacteriota bacterium]
MMMDPIADMLARIRNACMVRHKTVEVPASKMKLAIAKILKEEGYIEDFRFVPEGPQGKIEIVLKYDENKRPVIAGMRKVTKPGRRVYVKKDELSKVLGGYGIAIISTSQGIMTDKEARKKSIGGEVICEVW